MCVLSLCVYIPSMYMYVLYVYIYSCKHPVFAHIHTYTTTASLYMSHTFVHTAYMYKYNNIHVAHKSGYICTYHGRRPEVQDLWPTAHSHIFGASLQRLDMSQLVLYTLVGGAPCRDLRPWTKFRWNQTDELRRRKWWYTLWYNNIALENHYWW